MLYHNAAHMPHLVIRVVVVVIAGGRLCLKLTRRMEATHLDDPDDPNRSARRFDGCMDWLNFVRPSLTALVTQTPPSISRMR